MPLKKNGVKERLCIVIPNSLKSNYDKYIDRFTPNLNRSEFMCMVLEKYYLAEMLPKMKDKQL